MSKYIRVFQNHADYLNYQQSGMLLPNVSYCEDQTDVVHYNPIHDYSKDYMTFVALESGTITFTISFNTPTTWLENISYSLDNGETWITTNNVNNQQVTVQTPSLSVGDKVLWKCNTTSMVYAYSNSHTYNSFKSSGMVNVQGNIMSLLYGDNFIGQTDLTENPLAFKNLFWWYDTTDIVSAKNLILPATTLSEYCYDSMFYGCSNLVDAPELPATTLAEGCYGAMFTGTSLTAEPKVANIFTNSNPIGSIYCTHMLCDTGLTYVSNTSYFASDAYECPGEA